MARPRSLGWKKNWIAAQVAGKVLNQPTPRHMTQPTGAALFAEHLRAPDRRVLAAQSPSRELQAKQKLLGASTAVATLSQSVQSCSGESFSTALDAIGMLCAANDFVLGRFVASGAVAAIVSRLHGMTNTSLSPSLSTLNSAGQMLYLLGRMGIAASTEPPLTVLAEQLLEDDRVALAPMWAAASLQYLLRGSEDSCAATEPECVSTEADAWVEVTHGNPRRFAALLRLLARGPANVSSATMDQQHNPVASWGACALLGAVATDPRTHRRLLRGGVVRFATQIYAGGDEFERQLARVLVERLVDQGDTRLQLTADERGAICRCSFARTIDSLECSGTAEY
jgi:hypothetical protein